MQVVVLHKEVGSGLGFTLAGGVDQNKPVTVSVTKCCNADTKRVPVYVALSTPQCSTFLLFGRHCCNFNLKGEFHSNLIS